MVVTNISKNRIRDLIGQDISTAAVGTDGTPPSATDTDLIAKDATTENPVTVLYGDKSISITYILNSLTGNGNNYQEFAVYFSNGELLDRVVFPAFNKTDSVELHIIDIITIL